MHILGYLRILFFTVQYPAIQKFGIFWEKLIRLIKAVSIW